MSECALYTADERTKEIVAAVGAALGLTVRVISERHTLPERGLLLVATDLAPTSIPWRNGLLLLDLETEVQLSQASLVGMIGDFQEVATHLMDLLSRLIRNKPRSLLIAVASPCGGSGVTTLVALLGLSAIRNDRSVLLIDDGQRLARMVGAKCITVDRDLQPPSAAKIGVLAQGVKGLPPLLLDAKSKFDRVIVGVDLPGLSSLNGTVSHVVLLVPNTAIAAERCALDISDTSPVHVVVRQMAYGTLSVKQMSITLNTPISGEWPDDPEVALTADLGELGKSKRALHRATELFQKLRGVGE